MSKQPLKFEKIKEKYGAYPKPMMVNLEVAKTIPFKTQTRRLDTKWKVGDVLWVREPAKVDICFTEEFYFRYLSDDDEYKLFTMPIPNRLIKDGFVVDWMVHCNGIPNGCIKEMARTFLRVVEVRDEFLQDITYKDCVNEGLIKYEEDNHNCIVPYGTLIERWKTLWNSTAPKGKKWEDNPKVKVITFEKVEL